MKKRIHVRSKDPMRIARQMEKKMEGDSKKQRNSKGRPPPPQMKVNTICKVGNRQQGCVSSFKLKLSSVHVSKK